jgi:uncharacterized membrane protein
MGLTPFDAVLLGVSLAGQLLLFFVLLKRQMYRVFPIFFTYIIYSSASDIAFLAFFRQASEHTYLLAYLANSIPEFLLQIGILIEVARNVLNPVKRSLPRASLYVFMGMIATSTLVALLLSMHSEPADLDRWSQYGVHANFGVAILRLAIFTAIASFSQMLGIGWRHHVLQIATGFLAYSVAVLLVEMLHRHTGVANESLYHLHEQFRIIGWCMVLGYWSYALSRIEAPRKEFSPKMASFLVSIGEASQNRRGASARGFRK